MNLAAAQRKLGPGLLFAASAVGTSHLVQSTRAGADYGLIFAGLIVLVCLLKYPLFRFGAEYAAATGTTLIEGYRRRGKWLVLLIATVTLLEGVGAAAGVTLVTSGLAQLILGTQFPDFAASVVLLVLSGILVALGRYHFIENSAKVFVIIFSVLTLVSAWFTVPLAVSDSARVLGSMPLNRTTFAFVIAIMGWMPTGNTAAILLAAWVRAKATSENRTIPSREARFDFNVGYFSTIFLALCFLLMGAAVLYGKGQQMPGGSVGFAALLLELFSTTLGTWAYAAIAISALAVMYSTLLSIIDGFPRLLADIGRNLELLSRKPELEERQILLFVGLMVVLPILLLGFFLTSFTSFIDLVITVSFLIGPIIAAANHVLITGEEVPDADRPPRWILNWNLVAIVVLGLAALAVIVLRFS